MKYAIPVAEGTIGVLATVFAYSLYAGVSGAVYWYGWLVIGGFAVGGLSLGFYGLFTGIESAVSAAKE